MRLRKPELLNKALQIWGKHTKRFLIILLCVCVAVGLAYVNLGVPSPGIDDAYIFFVYGRNLAEGRGLVFNPGGDHVEGYSSPLWMFVVALSFIVSEHPEVILLGVSILLIVSALTCLWSVVDRGRDVTWRGILLLVWVFVSPSFVVWTSLTLMDTALWTSLLVWEMVMVLSSPSVGVLALLTALVVLARPEGMFWAPFFLGVIAIKMAAEYGVKEAWHKIRLSLLTYFAVLISLIIFRLVYFGYPLPNTYYAKVSPDFAFNLQQGGLYLLAFLTANKQIIFVVSSTVAGLVFNVRGVFSAVLRSSIVDVTRMRYFLVSLVCLGGLFVPTLTGGDNFGLFRFYQPFWPLFILPIFGLFDVLQIALPLLWRYLLLIVSVAGLLVVPFDNWIDRRYVNRIRYDFLLVEEGTQMGKTLNAMFEDDLPSIGVIAAGGIAFEYNGMVIDLMGLNNVEMAHAPGDRHGCKNHAAFNAEVFFEQCPQILVHQRDIFLNHLTETPRFLVRYKFATVSDGKLKVQFYFERNYLERLKIEGYIVELPQR